MISSIMSSVSAIRAFGKRMGVTSNNIANANTPGFKSKTSMMQDLPSQTVSTMAGTAQVGRGSALGDVYSSFDPGPFESTGNATDMAIGGSGFFVLREEDSDRLFYSRAGNFRFDRDGYLANPEGYVVQGWQLDENGNHIGSIRDIGMESSQGIAVDRDGIITGTNSNGEIVPLFQVPLADFHDPQGLHMEGGNLFSVTRESGDALINSPGTHGLGSIAPNSLEGSNVDLAKEITDTIPIQNGYEANLTVIKTRDEMLGTILDILG